MLKRRIWSCIRVFTLFYISLSLVLVPLSFNHGRRPDIRVVVMSGEYDDVLTNQPVVIDNVNFWQKKRSFASQIWSHLTGFWNDKSRFCWSGSPEMLLSVFVRFHWLDILLDTGVLYWLEVSWYLSVGRPKHVRVMAGALEGDVFIGRRAQEFRGLLKIKYPMEHGIVTDWDDMERIWQWVYAEELGTLSEEVCYIFSPILLPNLMLKVLRH